MVPNNAAAQNAGHLQVPASRLQGPPTTQLDAIPCPAQGWAPLHSAVSAGHDDVVQRLLSAGADVGIRTSGGQTPLHYAVRAQRDPMLCQLRVSLCTIRLCIGLLAVGGNALGKGASAMG